MTIYIRVGYNLSYALRSFVVVRFDMHAFLPTSMQARIIVCASKFILSLQFHVLRRTTSGYRALKLVSR
jgi:hypothetical protein